MPSIIFRRQYDGGDDDGYYWWDSSTAIFVKWAVLAAIIILFLVFFGGAYFHAHHRMKRGLAPLPYHQWLVSRRRRMRFNPALARPQNQFSFYQAQEPGYNMQPVPPPAYNPDLAPPPTYQPPVGASKADPSQHYPPAPPRPDHSSEADHDEDFAGPSTPATPSPVRAHGTGSTNPYR